ncbi:hypothetical protein [Fulvimarina manganoxydans]|uniref:hypothetical protein n=1 Tax=Fulvimarina manganoxydans TaxID=937218 RepID=UPI00111C3E02|nr:hypothetical protein [Fulvimarina manganoxydans]
MTDETSARANEKRQAGPVQSSGQYHSIASPKETDEHQEGSEGDRSSYALIFKMSSECVRLAGAAGF